MIAVDQNHPVRPIVFRNFDTDEKHWQRKVSWTDALLSTSAAPTYFDPKKMEDGRTLIDGGIGFNNPSDCVIHRFTKEITSPSKPVVWVSIGTGKSSHAPISALDLFNITHFFSEIATESEKAHLRAKKLMDDHSKVYRRFQPDAPLCSACADQCKCGGYNRITGDVRLDERDTATLNRMKANVDQWLNTQAIKQEIDTIALALFTARSK